MKPLLLCLLLSFNAHASFPEFFGSGASTSSLGNQANRNILDPANSYYAPAFAAWAKKISISAQTAVAAPSFNEITGIVTENSTNGQSGSATETGNANTTYDESFNTAIHFLLPLKEDTAGALAISVFAPIGRFAETNSGDPRLPEYSLYRARYRRTQIHFNYGLPLGERWAVSLGAHVGFQASARVNTQVSLSNNYGSSGSAKTKINPSLGGILSVAYNGDNHLSYFTFQQEMKSNIEAVATGEITDPSISLINVGLDNMVYYDPHIIRIGTIQKFSSFDLALSLEYQMWESYKAPIITVKNLGGSVRASDNYESLTIRNTINPKIGLSYALADHIRLNTGLFYRPTPFDGDFSGAGNTIDTDAVGASTGLTYGLKLFNKDIELSGALQYHHLFEETVTKTANQENGSAGQKIGAPGYTIGGHVLMVMGGIKVDF